MVKKKAIISAAISALAILAVVTAADRERKTADTAIISEPQEQATVEVEPITLTEPKHQEIPASEVIIEIEHPIEGVNETSTPCEPEPDQKSTESVKELPKSASQITTPAKKTYAKPPKPAATSKTPKNGEKKNGKIYVEGFGWIKDNGGGSAGTVASEMYENGNKIGTFG